MEIEKLRPNPKNARTHSKKQLRQIGDSISVNGFLDPVIVDESYTILAGHGRVEAARLIGRSHVSVIRFDHLSGSQKRAYVIASNRTAELAGWDRDLLAVELAELAELLPANGFDVSLTGFEVAEIDSLLADMEPAEQEAADTLPTLPAHPTSRSADLWELGKHRLLCGDARNAGDVAGLMNGAFASAVFCDPPYNLRVSSIGGRGRIQHPEFAFASGEMSRPR